MRCTPSGCWRPGRAGHRTWSPRAGRERAGAPGVDEWLEAELEFAGGATGTARCHMADDEDDDHPGRRYGGRGDRRRTSCCPTWTTGSPCAPAPKSGYERLGTRPSYRYQLDAFAGAVLDHAPLPIDADDAVATMALIDECYRAAGFPVRPTLEAG